MKNPDTKSFMRTTFYKEGDPEPLFLKAPTFWDPVNKKYFVSYQFPKSGKLLHADGETSRELENNWLIAINESLKDDEEFAEEFFGCLKK